MRDAREDGSGTYSHVLGDERVNRVRVLLVVGVDGLDGGLSWRHAIGRLVLQDLLVEADDGLGLLDAQLVGVFLCVRWQVVDSGQGDGADKRRDEGECCSEDCELHFCGGGGGG